MDVKCFSPRRIDRGADAQQPTKNSEDKGVDKPSGDGNPPDLGKNLPQCSPRNCSAASLKERSRLAKSINRVSLSESDYNSLDRKDLDGKRLSRRQLARKRREDSLKCLELERKFIPPQSASNVLIIRFPDPEITSALVTGLSPSIREAIVGLPNGNQSSRLEPRYCTVHLKAGADVEATISEINRVPFGNGFLMAERQALTAQEEAKLIDTRCLEVSNIPENMNKSAIKKLFAKCIMLDMGGMKKAVTKTTRALVRFATFELAREAFIDVSVASPQLNVRFRRTTKHSCLNKATVNNQCWPAVEAITTSDSDGNDGSAIKQEIVTSEQEHERDIHKLKLQMSDYGAIIKNLLARQVISDMTPKLEPNSCPEMSMNVHTPYPTPAYRLMTLPIGQGNDCQINHNQRPKNRSTASRATGK